MERTLIKTDYQYADPFISDRGTDNPQITSDNKIQVYENWSLNDFPDSSSSNSVWIAYIQDIDPSIDGEYYWLDWDGVNVAAWTIRNTWREFQLIPNTGVAGTDKINIKIEPNFTDVGWSGTGSGIQFDNEDLPHIFYHTPDPSSDPDGGFVAVDYLTSNTSSGHTTYIEPWLDYNAFTYKRYDIMLRPVSQKFRRIVTYNYNYWVCLANHTHIPGDSSTQPYFGSPYWKRVINTM